MPSTPPNPHSMVKAKNVMAVVQHKPKTVSKPHTSKDKLQMHRRSRTGCYTCRLRRKKCDEGSPSCTACRNLGLRCEYKRPSWWSVNEQRRLQKESIKAIIKRKKLVAKSTSTNSKAMTSRNPTPCLSQTLSTPATFADSLARGRSRSIESQLSLYDFNTPSCFGDLMTYDPQIHCDPAQYAALFPMYVPYDIDTKGEHEMYMNSMPTCHDPTLSAYPNLDMSQEWLNELTTGNLVHFSHGPMPVGQPFDLSEGDQRLLRYFVSDVLPTIFPILELNPQRSARFDHVIQALQSHKYYVHCCLNVAAQHAKATMNIPGENINEEIVQNRCGAINELCAALGRDTDHTAILETKLGMIMFQGSISCLDDTLPDIPWSIHFESAVSIVQKLGLSQMVTQSHDQHAIPFHMTLTAWIDILGATMQGRSPSFSHTYREMHLSATNASLGLSILMGCDDHVMYLISEIACLDDLKNQGLDDYQLCKLVHALGEQISQTETGGSEVAIANDIHGNVLLQQLTRNMTAAFRIAARIYLCSLVPGFTPCQPSCGVLITKLTQVLDLIPPGPKGYDRSLIWVYLIGGSVSTVNSPFRVFFEQRLHLLGDMANFGTIKNLQYLLTEVWSQLDNQSPLGGEIPPYVSWRDVMRMKGWNFLLI